MKAHIVDIVVGFGEMFNREISEGLITIWIRVLNGLTVEELNTAVLAYARDKDSCRFFPQPGQIYALARPEHDKEEQASIIVDNIFSSLRSYGCDKFNENRAQLKIGPVGWEWVQNAGGWATFVNSIRNEDDVPILRSQARKSIMGIIQQGKIETITLESLGVKMKEIDDRK